MPAPEGLTLTMHCLARSPNQTATAVLLAAIQGRSAGARRAALRGLSRRQERAAQLAFVRLFDEIEPEELAEITQLPIDFRRTLLEILESGNRADCETAVRMLLHYGAYEELPTLVPSAAKPDHPWGHGLATACFKLASRLHNDVARYQQHPVGRDPSFARHWGLSALGSAIDRFGDHRRVELVEAFLLLTRPDHPILRRLLNDRTHPCHEPLIVALRESHSAGAIGLMAALFQDPAAPIELVELAAQRTDAAFRKSFLATLGWPLSPRALEGAYRVRRLLWLDKRDSSWQQLTATEQAAAVELATASRLARRDKVAVIDFLMANGTPLARQTSIACLGQIECPEAVERLERGLDDYDPLVVATSAKILRKLGNIRAVPRLATLLDHQNLEVRSTAQGALRDFTFPKFLADFDSYDPQLRGVLARIVVHSDPQAIEHLRGELRAVTLQRKLRGLLVAREMHQAEAVVTEILELTDHKDVEIRCEALATLADCTSPEARETLVKATGDPNALVRSRAADALRKLDERNPPPGGGL